MVNLILVLKLIKGIGGKLITEKVSREENNISSEMNGMTTVVLEEVCTR